MLLAIDTATNRLGLAITDGARILAEETWLSSRHATVELPPEAARLLRRQGLTERDLSGLAVTIGPGSYTGLRIGLAFAKGLAFARGLKIVGVPTLDVLASGQPSRPEPMLALIHAGRGRWSAAWYKWSRKAWKQEGEGLIAETETLESLIERPTYVCGELTAAERKVLGGWRQIRLADPALCVRRPAVLASLGWARLRTRKASDPMALVPIYPGVPS